MVTNASPEHRATPSAEVTESGPPLFARLNELRDLLEEIRARLSVTPQTEKAAFTPAEFARAVGLSTFTVQDYCRRGRIRAGKALSGRGRERGWRIPADEIKRFEREGLLPERSGTGTITTLASEGGEP